MPSYSAVNGLLTVLSILSTCSGAVLVERDGNPAQLYKGLTNGAYIPFTQVARSKKQFAFTSPPWLSVSLNNNTTSYSATIDTGSSAFLVGAGIYPGFNAPEYAQRFANATGYEYLSSSQRLYTGYWVPTKVHFLDGNATSQVNVLLVTKMVLCSGYLPAMGGNCPNVTQVQCELATCTQTYMGVGFGRSTDGQVDITPANNALLGISQIAGKLVSAKYNTGYIIDGRGIAVGITQKNSQNFKLVKLAPTGRNLTHDWMQVSGCVTVTKPKQSKPAGACVVSSILLDTGIDQSYVTFTPANGWTAWNKGPGRTNLPVGTKVSVTFGEMTKSGQIKSDAKYGYTVGAKAPSTPSFASARLNETAGALDFINTGRNFYKSNDVLFDAVGGYWGLRAR